MSNLKARTAVLGVVAEGTKDLLQRLTPDQLKTSEAAGAELEKQRERLGELGDELASLEQGRRAVLFDDSEAEKLEELIFKKHKERDRAEQRVQLLEKKFSDLQLKEERDAISALVDRANGMMEGVAELLKGDEYIQAARKVALICALAAEAERARNRAAAIAKPAGVGGLKHFEHICGFPLNFYQALTLLNPIKLGSPIYSWGAGHGAGKSCSTSGLQVAAYAEHLLKDKPAKVLKKMIEENPFDPAA